MNQQGVQLQQNNQPNAGGAGGGRGNGNGGRGGGNWGKPDNLPPPPHQPCPRCNSWNTKFCYYNNYDALQLRYFCKTCKRNWTQGGALRNIPVGGNRKSNIPKPSMGLASSSSASFPPPSVFPPMAYRGCGNSMLFGGSENGAGFFLPNFASTIRGGMIQPPTGFPNMMGLINLPRYPVPPQNSLNLFGVRETGDPSSSAGEPNLGVGHVPIPPPAPTGQFEETNNNNEDNDETAKWFEFMKNNKT